MFAGKGPDFYIKFALGYTENRANYLAITAIASNHTWEEYKETLINQFRPVLKEYDLRAQLGQLKQGDNFDKYVNSFKSTKCHKETWT